MAFALVNPLTSMWAMRGLSYLLLPEDKKAHPVPQAWASEASAQRASSDARPSGPPRQNAWRKSAQGMPQNRQENTPPAGQARPWQGPAARQEAAPSSTTLAPPKKTPALPYLPPEAWPLAWQQRYEKTKPATIVWTYPQLGEDMCTPQNPGRQERGAFIARLLRDFGHAAGTHTWWPLSLPSSPTAGEDKAEANATLFWSGVKRLGARGVAMLGTAAAAAAGFSDNIRPPRSLFYHGYTVWLLWDVAALQHSETIYQSMLTFLRQEFRHVLPSL